METVWENLDVEIGQLPKVEDVYFQRHPIRYRSYRMVVASIWWGIVVVGATVLGIALPEWWTLLVGSAVLILVGLTFFGIHIGYRKRSYALRQLDLTYRKGWLFYSITTIPFNRIQHTDVSQGPLERKFALCTLSIYTAGGSTSDLSIPGLEEDEAQQLRDFIAKKAASYE
jgi:membrane protein YdbS with pleckstrin-like domain